MKRIISLLLIFVLCMPFCVNAEVLREDTSLKVAFETETVEVGDQFLVSIKKENSELKFLTFRINGTFDSSVAEIIAPVYTNEKLGVLTNNFEYQIGIFI